MREFRKYSQIIFNREISHQIPLKISEYIQTKRKGGRQGGTHKEKYQREYFFLSEGLEVTCQQIRS